MQANNAPFAGNTVGQRLYNSIYTRESERPKDQAGVRPHAFLPKKIEDSLRSVAAAQSVNVEPENANSLRETVDDLAKTRSVFAEALLKLSVDQDVRAKIGNPEGLAARIDKFFVDGGDDISPTRPLNALVQSALEAAEILTQIKNAEDRPDDDREKDDFETYVSQLEAQIQFRIDGDIGELEQKARDDSHVQHVID